jgi:hypothetical protein
MSNAQYDELYLLGIRPPQVQYLILYYSCLVPGIQVCFTWSYDGPDAVRELFRFDYAEHQPRISLIMPTEAN